MAIWARDINADPISGRTIGPDVVLGGSPGLAVTMVPGGGTGKSAWLL